MDFRKLISFGKSSFVISLPKDWLAKNNLKKGSLIRVHKDQKKIILTANIDNEKSIKKISIDISGLDRTTIIYYIQNLYKIGYDEIKINFSNPIAPHFRLKDDKKIISILHEVTNRLTGFEIIEQKENYCILKELSEISPNDFEIVMRRIFLLMVDASNDLLNGIKSDNRILIESIEEKHETISKFIFYSQRYLNKIGYKKSHNQTILLFHMITNMDKIVDVIKYAARNYLKLNKEMNPKAIDVIKKIDDSIRMYYEYFYKYDVKKISNLYKNRDDAKSLMHDIENKISLSENNLLHDLAALLEIITDITEYRIGLANL